MPAYATARRQAGCCRQRDQGVRVASLPTAKNTHLPPWLAGRYYGLGEEPEWHAQAMTSSSQQAVGSAPAAAGPSPLGDGTRSAAQPPLQKVAGPSAAAAAAAAAPAAGAGGVTTPSGSGSHAASSSTGSRPATAIVSGGSTFMAAGGAPRALGAPASASSGVQVEVEAADVVAQLNEAANKHLFEEMELSQLEEWERQVGAPAQVVDWRLSTAAEQGQEQVDFDDWTFERE